MWVERIQRKKYRCLDKHALVIVNYNAKKGIEIRELSNKIIDDVKEKFNIKLIQK